MLSEALAQVTTAIDTALEGVEVKSHPGQFTEDELGKILLSSKAVRVAISDIPRITTLGNGLFEGTIQFSAIVICSVGEARTGTR